MTRIPNLMNWERYLTEWDQLPASFMFSLPEVETITRLSEPVILDAIESGRLPAYQIATRIYRVTKAWLEVFLANCEVRRTTPQPQQPHRAGAIRSVTRTAIECTTFGLSMDVETQPSRSQEK
jgi:hypothetical protein